MTVLPDPKTLAVLGRCFGISECGWAGPILATLQTRTSETPLVLAGPLADALGRVPGSPVARTRLILITVALFLEMNDIPYRGNRAEAAVAARQLTDGDLDADGYGRWLASNYKRA